jgi:hypothetical protein
MHLPLKRAWATRLVDQLCAFPAVPHDDACDTLGLLCRGIDEMMNPYSVVTTRREGLKPFTGAWLEYDGDDETWTPRHS